MMLTAYAAPTVGQSPHFSIFGLPLNVGGLISLFLRDVTGWVLAGTATVIEGLGRALNASTSVPFGPAFHDEFAIVWRIAAALGLPLLILAAIQAIAQQDIGILLRAALIRLPLAFLLSGAAIELVSLGLSATDAMSSSLIDAAGRAGDEVVTRLGTNVATLADVADVGFAGFFLAAIAALVSFLLWLELVVRSAAVAVATLFVPIAMCGTIWPSTSHWARRLAETLVGLLLAKPAIAGVLALAATNLTGGSGLDGLVEGVALLVLASLAPMSLLRLLPMIDHGAVAHLEGLGRRASRAAWRGGVVAADVLAMSEPVALPRPIVDDIGYFDGSAPSPSDYEEGYRRAEEILSLSPFDVDQHEIADGSHEESER